MSEIKDCSMIAGDEKVIISRSTAVEALKAINIASDAGVYKGLYADDTSFLFISIKELEMATRE